jgi:hypothetical protein
MPVIPGIGTDKSQYANFVGDVFGLSSVYENQVLNVDQRNFANWSESATYGYYGGGLLPTPAGVCTIDRLDLSTETKTSPIPQLSVARYTHTATSSTLYGYFCGGFTGAANVSTIDRLDFSTETITVPTPKLNAAVSGLSAVSSSYFGYISAGSGTTNIYRLDFATETVANPVIPAKLSTGREAPGGTQSALYGYFGGGLSPAVPANVSTIDRLDLSTETTSVPTPKLSQSARGVATTSTSSYGYFCGGLTPVTYVSTISRLDFATETVEVPGPKLPEIKFQARATTSSSYGYIGGGFGVPTSPFYTSNIDRLNFTTETVSTISAKLTAANQSLASVSGGQSILRGNNTYGYFAGGFTPSGTPTFIIFSTIDRLDFSSETVSNPTNNLPTARYRLAATSSNSYGYFGGGTAPGNRSTIDRLDFSNETVSNPEKTLPSARSMTTTTSNSSYAYFAGGAEIGVINTISRLDFSNENLSNPGNNLPTGRQRSASVSSNSYGYINGGENSGGLMISNIFRLDFSNETITNPVNFPYEYRRAAAVSTNSYGYFGGGTLNGGSPPVSLLTTCSIYRFDFSTEIISTPTSKLSSINKSLTAVSSSFYGYFGGGDVGPSVVTTTTVIDRLDFSTETVSTPTSKLSQARQELAALSNSN